MPLSSLSRPLPAAGTSQDPLASVRLLEAIDRVDAILLIADCDQRVVAASTRAGTVLAQLGVAPAGVEGADLAALHGAPVGFREAVAGATTAPHAVKLKHGDAVYKSVTTALDFPDLGSNR